MAEVGKEILDGPESKVSVDGVSAGAMQAFNDYFEILNDYRSRLAACGVDFSSVAASAAPYVQKYYADDDIQIGKIRSDGAALKRSAADSAAQQDLVAQTKDLGEHWNDQASDQALDTYAADASRMAENIAELHDKADSVSDVAVHLENILGWTARNCADVVHKLINSVLHNN